MTTAIIELWNTTSDLRGEEDLLETRQVSHSWRFVRFVQVSDPRDPIDGLDKIGLSHSGNEEADAMVHFLVKGGLVDKRAIRAGENRIWRFPGRTEEIRVVHDALPEIFR